MTIFTSTLNQMLFLMLLILVGYLLARLHIVEDSATKVLSKIESNVFIPALVLSTFMSNFTVDRLHTAGQFLLCGLVVVIISIGIAILSSKLCTKDTYIQKIYTYGLAFSNFGFMGNAVVSAIFPDVFLEYLIFVLPFWVFIYLWGVPALLIPPTENSNSFASRLSALINPMFIAVIVGMIIGLTQLPIPAFLQSSVSTLGDCMSPIAMLLTGMTIAQIDLKKVLKRASIYVITAIRLVLLPVATIVVLRLLPIPYPVALCAVCAMAMPLGLNTIVIPSAYGKDTSVAAGMALVSHILSCITIPLVFMLFQNT